MSARGRPAVVLSVVALAVLAVVAATAVAGWAVVSVCLVAVGSAWLAALAALAVRSRERRRAGASPALPSVALPSPALPSVAALSTDLLGREWLRTSSALGGQLAAATRDAVATRRQDTLDELERRDPEGFARWLADDSPVSRNPAEFVHGRG